MSLNPLSFVMIILLSFGCTQSSGFSFGLWASLIDPLGDFPKWIYYMVHPISTPVEGVFSYASNPKENLKPLKYVSFRLV
jgi:hypothetical protein